MASIFMRLHVANTRPLARFLRVIVLCFLRNFLINNVAFRHRCDVYAQRSFRVRCRHRSTADESLDGETVDAECGNFASRPAGGLRGAISAPAGYGAASRSKQYVSKWTHGFFITINRMILYFKHIIHIDDFPLTGQPPSYYYEGNWDFKILNGNLVFLLYPGFSS